MKELRPGDCQNCGCNYFHHPADGRCTSCGPKCAGYAPRPTAKELEERAALRRQFQRERIKDLVVQLRRAAKAMTPEDRGVVAVQLRLLATEVGAGACEACGTPVGGLCGKDCPAVPERVRLAAGGAA